MRFGKIRIEDREIHFSLHMIANSVPCDDVVWAYHRRDSVDHASSDRRQLVTNYLVIMTKRRKVYQFSMTEKEVQDCLRLLKVLNPAMTTGFPKGSRILMESLPNTRDLGAIQTSDGRYILPGRLFRSGELYHMSMADRHLLEVEYNLKAVIDLRSAKEKKVRPDDILKGVEYYHVPLVDEEAVGFFQELTIMDLVGSIEGDPDLYMEERYVKMIRDPYTIDQIARAMEIIRMNQSGAVLWHCAFGKDRTDILTALLLCTLGVPRENVLEDYVRSNIYLAAEKEYALELMAARGLATPAVENRVRSLYEVKERYLDAVFRAIEQDYGSVSRFLRRGLYLTPRTIDDLKNNYLI